MTEECTFDDFYAQPIWDADQFQRKKILEIGSGEGYVTTTYLTEAESILAIDKNQEYLDELQKDWPERDSATLNILHGDIKIIDLPKNTFDVAIFSSSL